MYNVGTGLDLTIRELAEMVQVTIGHKGTIQWDTNKPDGTKRKLLNSEKYLKLGWLPNYDLDNGIQNVYKWYLANHG